MIVVLAGLITALEWAAARPTEAQGRTQASPNAALTPGNVVVYRVGDGVASLNSNAAAVFLEEFTPAGSLVQSIAMPTVVSGLNRRLTTSGTSTSEGFLTRSDDAQYLLVPGYDAAPGMGSITGSNWSAINRVIGRVNASGIVDTSTSLGDSLAGQNPRSAVSTNGTDLWLTTATAGIRYATFGATSSTSISSSPAGLRVAAIAGGQLYVSAAAGSINLATVGSGIPTTTGQTITNLPGFPTTGTPYGFLFADLSGSVAGLDTVYLADEGGQVQKFSLVSGNWVSNGTIALASARGLAGTVSGTSVTLFVTAGSSTTTLRTLTDTSGYNAAITGSLTTLATAAAGTAFRGVAMAPGNVPTNTAPIINSVAPTIATEDILFTYNATMTDPDGPGQTWSLLGTHTCGGMIVPATGVFTFTPAGPVPAASCVMAVQVCDGGTPNLCGTQTTTVNITAVNDPPVATDDSRSTTVNIPLNVTGASLTSNDVDADGPVLNVTAVSNPINGTVGLAAGNITFTPTMNYVGPASFEYIVSDGSLTDTGLVSVTVNGPAFLGSLNVGSGESITSLTNDGGLFQQMNAGTISGNVTVNITSDLSAETCTHSLNQLVETGTGGYTIFFQASGAARVISGNSGTALINLNGADRVTFSGLAFGPGGLTFRNAGNAPTFRLINDASNNSVLNCTVEGGNTNPASGVVFIGSGPTTGNDGNSVSGSIIRDRTDAAGIPLNLIFNDSSGGAGINSNTVIANNQLVNFTQTGLFNGSAENSTINGNTI
ncbi:MAG: cadherin-like domain-containing protein, partial [Acidobacteria bacterium]|nr:cadherin-like domain-containing protein [Acidobacteriota bacterium]